MPFYHNISFYPFTHSFWTAKKPLFDSRKLLLPQQTIFFALKGKQHNGHEFIETLYAQGVRHFVISDWKTSYSELSEAHFLKVENVLETLQQWAAWHRNQFKIPVVAITGSNGKTIVKEWLYQILDNDFSIVKSPKSYNSQLGVPVSVLEMNERHQVAIFEAGISKTQEMEKLAAIIRPTIGIFTNIGQAHNEGFRDIQEKIEEKLKLFQDCPILIYPIEHNLLHQSIQNQFIHHLHRGQSHPQLLSWGNHPDAAIQVRVVQQNQYETRIQIIWIDEKEHLLLLPFTNKATIENCINALIAAFTIGLSRDVLQDRIFELKDLAMRLEWKEAINNCMLMDDSYNNDVAGLQLALDFLHQKCEQHQTVHSIQIQRTLILSDVLEAGQANIELYKTIALLVQNSKIQRFIGIGKYLQEYKQLFEILPNVQFFASTNEFIQALQHNTLSFYNEAILLKGARYFEFERIARILQRRIHDTILEINLSAVVHNYLYYRSLLQTSTKMMVMVKAFAYGSDSYEIANVLQYHHVDYLGVAYTDEGVALRKKGIHTPIMVMNPTEQGFTQLIQYQLEPAIYSQKMLWAFTQYLIQHQCKQHKIHLEIDSGMHRLGLEQQDYLPILTHLQQHQSTIYIASVFSHLAAADEREHDTFTIQQISIFQEFAHQLQETLGYPILKHILNSAGITHFAKYQFDMVRLGIGLHGIDPNQAIQEHLQPVARLRTIISQIKTLIPTETVGYSRKGTTTKPTRIATIAIGYADGFLRIYGNGRGTVFINGHFCPIIGNVCMDMCFVDLGDTPAQEGDDVLIFGVELPIQQVATTIGTIPYEILTNVSGRVPRVFYEE